MTLRCKPGDLALVIGGDPRTKNRGNSGKVVKVLRFVGEVGAYKDCWEVNRQLSWTFGMSPHAPDRYLMPIRPDELKTKERERETA